ncbi:MAG TPA: cytochrome c oxidase subunit 3 [Vicinamibacterales bacterium]|nr:cytochrome c oxidase subunit 3 [Vicinamibacterales bacterium]
MSATVPVVDVSRLPSFAFGHRSILWWATLGLIAIEGTAFALMIAAYIYLKWRVPEWPPGVAPPDLMWGTLTTIVVLASCIPNHLTKKAAEQLDVGRTRLWIAVSLGFAIAFLVLRAFEFTTLNCWWDTNAYGSIVWMLLGAHTAHVITDVVDTAVIAAIFFTGPLDAHRFVDASENAAYYYFVVFSWLPIYAVIYLAPRLV